MCIRDRDSAELGKVINAHLQIGGNLKKALEYIALNVKENNHPLWDKEIEEFKKEFEVKETESFTPKKIIETVNSLINEYTPVATEVGQQQMWVSKYYNFKKPKTHLTSGGFGTMGYGMGAALSLIHILMAGENFDLTMTFLNTHVEKAVKNVKMYLTMIE